MNNEDFLKIPREVSPKFLEETIENNWILFGDFEENPIHGTFYCDFKDIEKTPRPYRALMGMPLYFNKYLGYWDLTNHKPNSSHVTGDKRDVLEVLWINMDLPYNRIGEYLIGVTNWTKMNNDRYFIHVGAAQFEVNRDDERCDEWYISSCEFGLSPERNYRSLKRLIQDVVDGIVFNFKNTMI